ncbi:hypothetical protein IAU60_002240 [Kwoniella sp. DSM 27419]
MRTVPDGGHIHPFLKGNFAPVVDEYVSHPCEVTYGKVPEELRGGQFDGDGMLHGVYFQANGDPLYTNRHLATPLLTMTLLLLRSPIPSIALLISPLSSLHRIVVAIIQAFFIAVRARMGVLSVANTSVVWWGKGMGAEAAAEKEDWMTAHPRVDPVDGSLIFYSTQMFDAPHARYSVIDRHGRHVVWKEGVDVGRAKMFQDPEPSLIFHTANAWDEYNERGELVAISLLGCRFKSAKLVYAAGAVDVPVEEKNVEDDVVRLHYYRFDMTGYSTTTPSPTVGRITHSFPIAAIPFEFPSVPSHLGMSASRFIYGCTMRSGSFDERLGGAAKVDCVVKLDVLELIKRGMARGPGKNMTPVDERTSAQIIADGQNGGDSAIQIFATPEGFYAQEAQFVPKTAPRSEDDGYLITYVYDEAYLQADGTPSPALGAGSELWVIDASRLSKQAAAVSARVKLPQRVPYGLHGTFVSASLIRNQRVLRNPLPEQPTLQFKLARSRLQHFASIIFGRPTSRDKSRFEKAVLTVLWPAAFGMLILAVIETVNYV